MPRRSFIHVGGLFDPAAYSEITSFNRVKPFVKGYLNFTQTCADKIFNYVKELGGFVDKSVQKRDLLFLFIRPVEDAFGEEDIVAPVESAIVESCANVSAHFPYVWKKKVVFTDVLGEDGTGGDNDSESEDEMGDTINFGEEV